MKRTFIGIAAAALTFTLAGIVSADEKKPAAPEKIGTSEAVMVKATVEAVDTAARTVTLKGPRGKTFTVSVDDKVANLSNLKVGDEVVAKYFEAIAFELKKPGEAVPGKTVREIADPAGAGGKRAGFGGREVTVVAPIEAINAKKGTVTLRSPEGKSVEVTAKDPKNLSKVKVGDLVEITYTEALAVSIEAAPKAPGKQ
jgi:hypothetical protein